MSKRTLDNYFERTMEHGAKTSISLGPMGSGKTTWLMLEALLGLHGLDLEGKQRAKETPIWRVREYDRWHSFINLGHQESPPAQRLLLFVPHSAYEVVKISQGGKVENLTLEDADLDYVIFDDTPKGIVELVRNLDYTRVNGIATLYAGAGRGHWAETRFWVRMFKALLERDNLQWLHLYLDELSDIFPQVETKETSRLFPQAETYLNDFRKSYIGLSGATHHLNAIHWRIASKIFWYFYFPGAERVDKSMVKQRAISNLDIGHAIIDTRVSSPPFEIFSFSENPDKEIGRIEYRMRNLGREIELSVDSDDFQGDLPA